MRSMLSCKWIQLLLVLVFTASISPAPMTNLVTVKGLLDMANAIRANPPFYSARVQTLFKDQMVGCVRQVWNLTYQECLVAIDEAIAFLLTQPPVGPLTLNQGTTRVSWEHSEYLATQLGGTLSHTGPSTPPPTRATLSDRWVIYNSGSFGALGENIIRSHPNYWSTEEIVLLSFIIDDGVANRGHRTNFFNPVYQHVGIGVYPYTDGAFGRDMITMYYH